MAKKIKNRTLEETEKDFEFLPAPDKSTVRGFVLKHHEITMAAKSEIEKLQAQLIFVSMADYNVVVEENKKLRQLVAKYKTRLRCLQTHEDPAWLSKSEVLALTGLKAAGINTLVIHGQLKTKKEGKFTYYYKDDIEHLTNKTIAV